MGAITGLLGIGGGGASFRAGQANVVDPLQALAQQNAGAQNATNLVTSTAGQVAPAAATGVANQNQVYQQMQQLAGQLGQQAQGQGPNPALAQLAQSTGQNIAGTTAAMAGARGANANPGLIAREAAQQGAATQQNAVGQAATLQAQQQLAAQQQLQAQQQSLAGLGTTQVGEGLNAASTGAQAAQNQAGLLGQQVQGFNQANVANTGQANSANAGVQTAAQGKNTGLGAILGLASGGEVPSTSPMTSGPQSAFGKFMAGFNNDAPTAKPQGLIPMGLSALGAPANSVPGLIGAGVGAVRDALSSGPATQQLPADNASVPSPSMDPEVMRAAKGGKVPAMLSPGELYLTPEQAKQVAAGTKSPAEGEKIPGKAKVKGDSLKNDTVKKTLEAGGVVIPRSKTVESKDPMTDSAKFVAAVLARRSRR